MLRGRKEAEEEGSTVQSPADVRDGDCSVLRAQSTLMSVVKIPEAIVEG